MNKHPLITQPVTFDAVLEPGLICGDGLQSVRVLHPDGELAAWTWHHFDAANTDSVLTATVLSDERVRFTMTRMTITSNAPPPMISFFFLLLFMVKSTSIDDPLMGRADIQRHPNNAVFFICIRTRGNPGATAVA